MMKTLDQSSEGVCTAETPQSGMILIALLVLILPLLLLVGASSGTMTQRNKELMNAINLEKAIIAADSGIDEALYQASNANLISGSPQSSASESPFPPSPAAQGSSCSGVLR